MRDRIFGANPSLVQITLLGVPVEVPAGETLLRCFQYLAMETVSTGPFCWNGECGHSLLRYRAPGMAGEQKALACRTRVVPGMEITGLSPDLRRVLRPVLGDRAGEGRRFAEPS